MTTSSHQRSTSRGPRWCLRGSRSRQSGRTSSPTSRSQPLNFLRKPCIQSSSIQPSEESRTYTTLCGNIRTIGRNKLIFYWFLYFRTGRYTGYVLVTYRISQGPRNTWMGKTGKGASGARSRESGASEGRGEASQPRDDASTGGGRRGRGSAYAAFRRTVVSFANFGGASDEWGGGGTVMVRS